MFIIVLPTLIYIYILLGGLEHEPYDFPYIGNVIIPFDELIFFIWVETTNQICYSGFIVCRNRCNMLHTIYYGQ